MPNALEQIRKAKVTVALFIFFTIWWLLLNFVWPHTTHSSYIFGASYGLVALWGGIRGIKIASRWGYLKSVMGKGIVFLSLGLLAEELGQLVFSYYNLFLKVDVPYPSFADIGFFGTIPLYIIGIVCLAKVSGVQLSFKKLSVKHLVLLLPLFMLIFSYGIFLKHYTVDTSNILKTFLDFGYPLGQAIYVSIALVTYMLSRGVLGGVMKSKILLVIIAFIVQYAADFNFLFQSNNSTWINGGYGDYLYLLAYAFMAFSLVQMNSSLDKLLEKEYN